MIDCVHNEELHSLYRSHDVVRAIKSRRLRWAGHVARMEEGTSAFTILISKPTLLYLTERNANHIFPSCCALPVSYRSLVDRCGSLGSCKPQISFF